MNYDNPLEILLSLILILGSIWLIERIIKGAFKTVIAIVIILGLVGTYKYLNGQTSEIKHKKIKYEKVQAFNFYDFTNYESFKRKFKIYEDNTIKDLKSDYSDIKENNKK